MVRWLGKIIFAILGIAILLALAGFLYQTTETRADSRRSPEPGRRIDIGGYKLLIHCTGSGSPTIILEAGLGDLSDEWDKVQPEVAKFARVCSYDRAGYGGSDAGPMPRTSAEIAKELHALLQNAGEAPPYVLVGHSFGGYNVRVFNGNYPHEVSALVLVDSTQEDQYNLLPSAWERISASQLQRYRSQAKWASLFVGLGIARLILLYRNELTPDAYLILQPKYLQARASELQWIKTSAQQAHAAGNISNKPLIVLTAGKNSDAILQSGLTKQDFDDFHRLWVNDLQVRLVHLSSRGKQMVLADSGHDIPSECPDAVVDAVKTLESETQHK